MVKTGAEFEQGGIWLEIHGFNVYCVNTQKYVLMMKPLEIEGIVCNGSLVSE